MLCTLSESRWVVHLATSDLQYKVDCADSSIFWSNLVQEKKIWNRGWNDNHIYPNLQERFLCINNGGLCYVAWEKMDLLKGPHTNTKFLLALKHIHHCTQWRCIKAWRIWTASSWDCWRRPKWLLGWWGKREEYAVLYPSKWWCS